VPAYWLTARLHDIGCREREFILTDCNHGPLVGPACLHPSFWLQRRQQDNTCTVPAYWLTARLHDMHYRELDSILAEYNHGPLVGGTSLHPSFWLQRRQQDNTCTAPASWLTARLHGIDLIDD